MYLDSVFIKYNHLCTLCMYSLSEGLLIIQNYITLVLLKTSDPLFFLVINPFGNCICMYFLNDIFIINLYKLKFSKL